MSEEELDDLSMPEEIGETDSQDEMYEHFSVTVDKGQGMLRIDKFLTNRMEGASRNRIQTAADAGNILVNGVPVKSSYKVKPLDRVSIVMPYPLREVEIIPENIPLDIRYEDDDLIIVNKPAGMVVHPGHGNYSGTLVNALTYHLKDLPLFRDGDMRAGLVHRIDKNTSGILVVAKNERAHARLAKQFFDHSIHRVYHALVWGNMEADEGTVVGNIGRSVRDRLKMAVFPDGDGGTAPLYSRAFRLLRPVAARGLLPLFTQWGVGGDEAGFPAAVLNRVGKGKVVYIPAAVARDYDFNRMPAIRAFFGLVLREAAVGTAVALNAPSWVDLTLRRSGEQLQIHLINRATGIPNLPNQGAVAEIPATGPLAFRLKTARKPRSVRGAWEHAAELEWSWEEGVLSGILPQLRL